MKAANMVPTKVGGLGGSVLITVFSVVCIVRSGRNVRLTPHVYGRHLTRSETAGLSQTSGILPAG